MANKEDRFDGGLPDLAQDVLRVAFRLQRARLAQFEASFRALATGSAVCRARE